MQGGAGPSLERPAGPAIGLQETQRGFQQERDMVTFQAAGESEGIKSGCKEAKQWADVATGVRSGMERNGGIWEFLNTWN